MTDYIENPTIRRPKTWHTVPVPFVKFGDVLALTTLQLRDEPWLYEFFDRWRVYFTYDFLREIWIYKPK